MNFDVGIIIAVVGSAMANVGVFISVMFWVRSEGNALRAEQKEDRRELLQVSRNIETEMKDFHHRLIEIERQRRSA
jgi:hypothetical protein